ncbi:MAG: OmpA family protein [Nitrospirota bacterium]|nr:OmpA family protein [Nitrospirota bacterium]
MERYRAEATLMNKHMAIIGIVAILGLGLSGCVSNGTHEQTLAELDKARKAAAQQAEVDKSSLAEQVARVADLEKAKALVGNELLAAQTELSRTQAELVRARDVAEREQESSRRLRDQVIKAQEESRQVQNLSGEVRRERDQLKTKADDLNRQLETGRQDLANRENALSGTKARVAVLEKQEQDLTDALSAARGDIRNLTTKLEAEHTQVATLQEDKKRLLGGTTTAQSEIARLQKRAGELETEAMRAKDLDKQVTERNQEIGLLRHSLADRDAVAAALASQGGELKNTRQRVDQLTAELATMSGESAAFKHERDNLAGQVAKLDETTASLKKSKEEALASLETQQAALKRLEQEKAAKDAEIKRLAGTYEDLAASLRSEIAQGDIKIKQVQDRLTINVVDRILFDSGSAKIKPAGLKVMKTVGDVLKKITDKQIRIEGHTDNVPIGVGLKDRFASNWELSTARATSVVRYLIDEGGVAPEFLTAAGHADTQPVVANTSDEGRAQNRRIEIALYPKDLRSIAEGIR